MTHMISEFMLLKKFAKTYNELQLQQIIGLK